MTSSRAPTTIVVPVNSWRLRKFKFAVPLAPTDATAPAIGGPERDAKLLILWAIPNHVPRLSGYGQTCGNTLGGSGMRAPENPPDPSDQLRVMRSASWDVP